MKTGNTSESPSQESTCLTFSLDDELVMPLSPCRAESGRHRQMHPAGQWRGRPELCQGARCLRLHGSGRNLRIGPSSPAPANGSLHIEGSFPGVGFARPSSTTMNRGRATAQSLVRWPAASLPDVTQVSLARILQALRWRRRWYPGTCTPPGLDRTRTGVRYSARPKEEVGLFSLPLVFRA